MPDPNTKDLIEASRIRWRISDIIREEPTPEFLDAIQTGCIMRIANSMETLARDRSSLEREVERLRKSNAMLHSSLVKANRRVAAYKGKITGLRKKVLEWKTKADTLELERKGD